MSALWSKLLKTLKWQKQALKNASGACLNIHMTVKWFITLHSGLQFSNNLAAAPLRVRREIWGLEAEAAAQRSPGERLGLGVLIAVLICSFRVSGSASRCDAFVEQEQEVVSVYSVLLI